MIIFPAIDLKEGKCVRLVRGEMSSATVFNDAPADQAMAFERAGFQWLHMVDLDGAFSGMSANQAAVASVLKRTSLPVQLGGGIRDLSTIEKWLNAGVTRVILGTIAFRDPGLVKRAARQYPGKIVVGIDAKSGRVAVEGWAETTHMSAIDLAMQFQDAGVAALIYTDIARDGTGLGVNIEETAELASSVTIPVIASGGIGSIQDLQALAALCHPNIQGVICGRALYDGRLNAAEALAVMQQG